jgi:hypothetical protein
MDSNVINIQAVDTITVASHFFVLSLGFILTPLTAVAQ